MKIDKILKKQKGAIILMFLLLLPFMLGFVGLAVDLSYLYTEKTRLQNAADAAALAGVVHMRDNQDTTASDYVAAMLLGNSFNPVGDDPASALSVEQNWKLNYLKKQKNANNQDEIIEVFNPEEANRLRVTLMKRIPLLMIPVVVPNLATIDLTSVAVAQGTLDVASPVGFQIITKGTLRLGSCIEAPVNQPDSGDVHIPSYPSRYANNPAAKDPEKYDDYGEYLDRNIFAAKLDFKENSSLRIAGKFITSVSYDSKPANLELISKENFLPESNNEEGCSSSDIKDILKKHYKDGFTTYKEATRPDKPIKAILIDLYDPKNPDVTTHTYSDYNILNLREKAEYKDTAYFDELEIKVPVIFYRSDKKSFTISTNISFFNFNEALIVINGNLLVSGSKTPADAPENFGKSKRKKTTFSNVYCYATKNQGNSVPNTNAVGDINIDSGNFIIAGGSSAPKDFEGIIYADSGIRINACKNNRRHIFRNTIISPNDVVFAADHYSYAIVPVCYRFDSLKPGEKISLVE